MIYVNFDKYGVLNHIEYNDEVIFKGNNNVNKVFVCFDGIELKPQHYLTYSALINDKDYSGNLTDLASIRTTYNGKDGYMFSIFSNLTKDAGTLKLSIRLVDRLTDAILVSGILPLIVQDSAISTYSNVNITTTQYQALLTAFDDLSQTFNETNFKTINEESLFGEGNITLPTIEYVDALNNNMRDFVNDNITNLGYADESLRNQINEQNKVIAKQDRRIKVLELASEGNILNTTTEEDIAYEVNATSDILPFAEINKIGGMTYKSNNLANQDIAKPLSSGYFNTTQGAFGKIESGKQYTFSAFYKSSINTTKSLGLRAMSNSDGSGTNLGNLNTITLTNGKRVSITFTSSYNGYVGLNGSGFDSTDTITDITLNEGLSDLGYQPYFEGLRNSAVNQVVVKGANLQKTNWSGINSTIELSETLKAGQKYTISIFITKKATDYGINIYEENNDGNNLLFNASYTNWAQPNNGWNSFVITPIKDTNYLRINCYGIIDEELQGAVLKGALVEENKWVKANLYKPYKEPTTYTIPTTITSIDGYGIGIDETYHNYVDFANRKFVEHNKKIIINPNDLKLASADRVYIEVGTSQLVGSTIIKMISNNFIDTQSWANMLTTNYSMYNNTTSIYFHIDGLTTLNEYKEYFTNNQTEVIYSLANPTETDLTYRITDDFIIEIEGNGTIIFDNQYKQAIPYNWTYQEKL